MYKKVLNPKPHRNNFCHAVYVDGRYYSSLFQAAIDFEFSYCSFYTKVMKHDGPVSYSGHQVVLMSWVESHPEYKLPENPEGENYE
ncbi:MAG: hypothetical protein J6X11_09990 [Treponema sp.]|nr:hypothetical protein [Treponema sp.]